MTLAENSGGPPMTDDTGPKTRRADPLMTMTIRIGRIETVDPVSIHKSGCDVTNMSPTMPDINLGYL